MVTQSDADKNTKTDQWRRASIAMMMACGGVLCVIAALIVIVDPHDHLSLSPALSRAPINANQRYSYPALARSERFDSVVIGTSTTRLLRPQGLQRELGGQFVNLAMNSATAYEQARLLEVFLRHHQQAKTVLLGIDNVWCATGAASAKYTKRPFPQWMYDSNPWNDYLHVWNGATLEQTIRQLQFFAGRREPRFGLNGYRTFLPDVSEYDLGKARRALYGADGQPREREPGTLAPESTVAQWRFPDHQLLREQFVQISADTKVVFMFVPYHHYNIAHPQSSAGQRLNACKQGLIKVAQSLANAQVVDFMFASALTRTDEHYWDPLHYSESVAETLAGWLGQALRGQPNPDYYQRLH